MKVARLAGGLLVMGIGLCFAAECAAQLDRQCTLGRGDSLKKVKEIYGFSDEPRKWDRVSPGGTASEYRLPQYGIWIFFDEENYVKSVRLEQPFRGRIRGIGVGDSREDVRRLKGEPSRQFEGMNDPAAAERRKARKREILAALPDPAPRYLVMKAFDEITALDATPTPSMNAWLYGSGTPTWVRYDIGAVSNRVEIIFTEYCAE